MASHDAVFAKPLITDCNESHRVTTAQFSERSYSSADHRPVDDATRPAACRTACSDVGGSYVNTTNARTTLLDDGHAINLHLRIDCPCDRRQSSLQATIAPIHQYAENEPPTHYDAGRLYTATISA